MHQEIQPRSQRGEEFDLFERDRQAAQCAQAILGQTWRAVLRVAREETPGGQSAAGCSKTCTRPVRYIDEDIEVIGALRCYTASTSNRSRPVAWQPLVPSMTWCAPCPFLSWSMWLDLTGIIALVLSCPRTVEVDRRRDMWVDACAKLTPLDRTYRILERGMWSYVDNLTYAMCETAQ